MPGQQTRLARPCHIHHRRCGRQQRSHRHRRGGFHNRDRVITIVGSNDTQAQEIVEAVKTLPVMEGKTMLFNEFAGIDAFPLCLDSKDDNQIVATVKAPAPAPAYCITDTKLSADCIIPAVFNYRITPTVTEAVHQTGVARREHSGTDG